MFVWALKSGKLAGGVYKETLTFFLLYGSLSQPLPVFNNVLEWGMSCVEKWNVLGKFKDIQCFLLSYILPKRLHNWFGFVAGAKEESTADCIWQPPGFVLRET